jgi:hypothetical protein
LRSAGSEAPLLALALAAAAAGAACGLGDQALKVGCATDDDCLAGHVCHQGICGAPDAAAAADLVDAGSTVDAAADGRSAFEPGVAGLDAGGEVSDAPDAPNADAQAPGADASSADGRGGADAVPRCRLDMPFGPPVLRADLDGVSAGGIALDVDERTIYVSQGTAPDSVGIYVATRPTSSDLFGAFTWLSGLVAGQNWAPKLSGDGLVLYYTSLAPGGDAYAIRRARRPALDMPFASDEPVAELYSGYGDGDPAPTADGLAIYFTSLRPGGFGYLDLYVAQRSDPNGSFGPPRLLTALSSPLPDLHPLVSQDQLTIYFSSYRLDGGSRGGADIWVSHRLTPEDPFGDPENAADLNSADNDWTGWLSPDQCVLYFFSSRDDHNTVRTYQATRGR